ncbi:MAG: HlyD family efflux transporter periplasmic adaptor subunit [Opitutae bacterium]|nr:HlyD family efflux transporter periplasmic adaptor subunit [Opitutae bacterium]
MIATLPRLRDDLAFSQQTTADGPVFVVKDPCRDRFFRLPEEARFIAGQLDGATSLQTVCQRTEERFQTPLALDTLTAFIRHLDSAGLLANDDHSGRARPTRPRPRRFSGNLLYLRIRLLDPDRLLNRLAHPLRFFYTPAFLAVSAALIVAAVVTAVTNWDDVTANLPHLYQLANLPVILGIIFLVIAGHEFAHGLTCKHFGGEVREIGFLLLYFQPALYCNVSDAWLFPKKSQLLWVGFAGPYFELFLWALATLAWRLTDFETTVNLVAFIIMTSSGLKTLLNFNPLIKLDGYYLLGDWLEIPNLRRRSFALIGRALKRIGGAEITNPPVLTARERRICLLYGLVAVVPSLALLVAAFFALGNYFVAQSQPVALAAVTGLLGLKVRRRFRRLFGGKSAAADPDDDDLPAANEPPSVAAGAPPPLRKKKKSARGRWRLPLCLAGTGAAAALSFFCRMELRVGGPFEFLPRHNADVRAQLEDIIEQITVHEGDQVRVGDLVARLAGRDVRAQLQDNAANLAEARVKAQMLAAGPRPEEIQLAETSVAKTEAALRYAQSQWARNQALAEKHLISDKELEDSRALVTAAESDRAEAASRLKLLCSGSRPEEIAAANSEVERLQAQRRYLEEQVKLLDVKSPATGIVATPERELEAMRHQLVKKGALVAKVYELRTITAEIAVSERDIADVQTGQKVVLKVRAFPELTFIGKVVSIATTAQGATSSPASILSPPPAPTRSSSAPKMILLTTEIENPSLLLKPEMTGQAKIVCGKRRIIDLLTRRIARTIRVEFWSWW